MSDERRLPVASLPNWAKLIVSSMLLTWLALHFDWAATWDALGAVYWFTVGTGFLLMILAQMIGARRLQLLLATQHIYIAYLASLRLTFVGLFASNFLPSTVGGDVVKILTLVRDGHARGTSTLCVLVDRLINFVAIVFLFPTLTRIPGSLDLRSIDAASFAAVGLLLAGGMVVTGCVIFRHTLRRSGAIDPDSAWRSLVHSFASSISLMRAKWTISPLVLLVALCLSWISVLSGIVAVWVAARGLDIPIGFVELVAIVVLVYLAALLPISFNGLGVQELSLVYLLPRSGATSEQALALAVLVRLFYVGTSLLGAFDISVWRRPK